MVQHSTPFANSPITFAVVTVGVYNVGILAIAVAGDIFKKVERELAADCVKAFDTHKLDILCFSKLGELSIGLDAVLPFEGGVKAWIAELLQCSAAHTVVIYADSHYATIVRSERVQIDPC